ncbi:MAG: PEP-CTERM sorting domain-containing protein [Phycisphaerae bacterium]
MNTRCAIASFIACVAGLAAASALRADVLLGSFETGDDGFSGFSASGPVPFASATNGTYAFVTEGATDGSKALAVTSSGFAQNLAYDFVAAGKVGDFQANDVLSFDVTFPAAPSGFQELYQVVLNFPGNFANATPNPVPGTHVEGTTNSPTTVHVSFNYDSFKASVGSNPQYFQLVIANNNDGTARTTAEFDNFRLSSVPEPASLGVLGAGALLMLRRRRA